MSSIDERHIMNKKLICIPDDSVSKCDDCLYAQINIREYEFNNKLVGAISVLLTFGTSKADEKICGNNDAFGISACTLALQLTDCKADNSTDYRLKYGRLLGKYPVNKEVDETYERSVSSDEETSVDMLKANFSGKLSGSEKQSESTNLKLEFNDIECNILTKGSEFNPKWEIVLGKGERYPYLTNNFIDSELALLTLLKRRSVVMTTITVELEDIVLKDYDPRKRLGIRKRLSLQSHKKRIHEIYFLPHIFLHKTVINQKIYD